MNATSLDELTNINVEDLLSAFGIEKTCLLRRVVGWAFRSAGRRFAQIMMDYDEGVAQFGLDEGGRRILTRLHMSLTTLGQENIPASGPVLIVSNHPGMADTVALFASLPRQDIQIVAADRPFLRALKATSQRLIFVPDEESRRMDVLRIIAGSLRAGGGILTFPGGKIEPDPDCMPGALEALQSWSESTGFFARMVPGMCIVPAIVRGVIAAPSLRHPLTRMRRQQKDREKLAAALQLLVATYRPQTWPVHIQVRFGEPVPATSLSNLRDPRAITRVVIEHVGQYM